MVLSGALALAFGMNSCSDYDNGYTSKDIAYKEQFYNMFGNADPNHTWNMAQSRSLDVTINSEGTYTVKVWTANPRLGESNAFLLGQYDRVPGGATSSFACDMPQDVKTAYVGIIDENGDRIILPSEVKDGKVSVEFGALGTRTAFSGGNGSFTYTAIDKSNGKEFQKGDMDAPLNTLPERQQNIGKVSQDFEYVSTGEFTIYPMYLITSNAGSTGYGERLGIYLYDSNGDRTETVWIWQSTINTRSPEQDDNGFSDGIDATRSATWFDGFNPSTGQWETDFFAFDESRNLKGWENGNPITWLDSPKVVWSGDNFVNPYTKIRAEGVTVNIPEGTRFGMVLDARDGGPYYSNSAYNKDQGWPFPGTQTKGDEGDGVNDVYAATFEYQGRLYLAFEDWNYGHGDHDCDFNDVVFVMPETTKKPIVIDKDTKDVSMSYIVACEDLGGTFDWDFNDVVYAIEHVSGQQKAKLKLLAAGGTLPVKISYDGKEIWFNGKNGLCEDLHEAFGVDQKTPVNVGGYSASPVYSEEFEVGADAFSMSTHASAFKIHVKYSETLEVADIGVPDRSAGQEPQAFLVADPNWKWPNEKVNITSVYPKFTEWVANLNENWCGSVWGDEGNGTPTTGDVIPVKGYLTYSGNVATFPLDENQMKEYTSYQIVLETSANATVKFFDAKNKEIPMTDGNVQAGQQSTFTLSGEALNALKGGRMTITFPDGQAAEGRVTKLDWVLGTEKVGDTPQEKTKPTFEVSPTSLTFEPEDWAPQHITCTTNNSTGAAYITYKSMNTEVATIDGNGNVTPVAGGKTYLVANLPETDTYHSATAYITVEVKGQDPELKVYEGSVNYMTTSLGGTSVVNVGFGSKNPDAVVVTSSDESIVTAVEEVANGSRVIKLTGVGAGTATVTVRQKATASYREAEAATIKVTVNDTKLVFNNDPKAFMDKGSWDYNNHIYSWTYKNTNVMTLFTFDIGKLKNYKSIYINTPTLENGPLRLLFMNDSKTLATIRLYSTGGRYLNFSAYRGCDEKGDPKPLEGVDLSDVTKIGVGGETDSGSCQITEVYLSEAEH